MNISRYNDSPTYRIEVDTWPSTMIKDKRKVLESLRRTCEKSKWITVVRFCNNLPQTTWRCESRRGKNANWRKWKKSYTQRKYKKALEGGKCIMRWCWDQRRSKQQIDRGTNRNPRQNRLTDEEKSMPYFYTSCY